MSGPLNDGSTPAGGESGRRPGRRIARDGQYVAVAGALLVLLLVLASTFGSGHWPCCPENESRLGVSPDLLAYVTLACCTGVTVLLVLDRAGPAIALLLVAAVPGAALAPVLLLYFGGLMLLCIWQAATRRRRL